MTPNPDGAPAPKVIAVFSDGTGNSAAKLFKTNVWRLYQALDLAEPTEPGVARQIAFYDDGVGASAFRPLALLGGAFGVGLKRNVLDLYTFLCRNYRDGDRIYAFGFSRGAFTIRVMAALVAKQGLVQAADDESLERYARDAYRAYRGGYRKGIGVKALVGALRRLRSGAIALRRKLAGQPLYDPGKNLEVKRIDFVGVWDTVAAYGSPFAELTRAIDKWLWPMSMPDYVLHPKVAVARHALALDDERDTFHPLLWDEVEERELARAGKVPEGRIEQVWFAGMHSDVGGGYPDDALSQIPLAWMAGEAERAGLRFRKEQWGDVAKPIHHSCPMHDSRRGLGGYYRYQPRRISARLEHADPTALIMRSPNARGRLASVKIHESVFQRIATGGERYAPIVLPAEYRVVRSDGSLGPPPEVDPARRAELQQWVWNDVWRRRVNYFSIILLSLLMAALPAYTEPSACSGPLCAIPALTSLAAVVLPGFLQGWLEAVSHRPGALLLLGVLIVGLLGRSGRLQVRIEDGMRELWVESLAHGFKDARSAAVAKQRSWLERRIRALWSSNRYQTVLRRLKWTAVPNAIGLAATLAIVALLLLVAARAQLSVEERWASRCEPAAVPATAPATFRTSEICWPTGWRVTSGQRYRITLTVREPWRDASIVADPTGFASDRFPLALRGAVALRRSLTERWFQPMVRIAPSSADDLDRFDRLASSLGWPPPRSFGEAQGLEMRASAECDCPVFVGDFAATRSGDLYLFVNDALPPRGWGWILDLFTREDHGEGYFYANNSGSAEVRIEGLD